MRLRTIFAATLMVAATSSVAIACSVPVFRYALEHWHPEPYRVFVFHTGLTNDQQAVVDSMQPVGANGAAAVNLSVKMVDVSMDIDPIIQRIWQDHQSETLPWLVVQSPPVWGPPQTIWQGELSADNTAVVMDSPVRTQISRKLIEGESAVWLLLECGQKEADDKAFHLLTSELTMLETRLQLPGIATEDLTDLSVAPSVLKVAFSVIRISRDDAEEQTLVEMLLRAESDLLEEPQVSQPMAFPVFGRGRVLYALVGDGIAPDVIEEACQFLTGECQCEVKAENPGVDLIMHVDWDRFIIPTATQSKALASSGNSSGTGGPGHGAVYATIPVPKGHAAATTASEFDADGTDSVHTSSADTSSAGTSSTGTSSTGTSSTGTGTNVAIVLVFLAVSVVIATLFLRSRTS